VGYGSAMIANKLPGVFAAVCQDPFCAGLARSHSDTNVLCVGGKIIGSAIALEIVRVWMSTDWLGAVEGGEKYGRPVQKVADIDARYRSQGGSGLPVHVVEQEVGEQLILRDLVSPRVARSARTSRMLFSSRLSPRTRYLCE